MMNAEESREFKHTQPFLPFVVRTSDDRSLIVRHPDFIAIGPNSFLLTIYDDTGHHLVNMVQITSIHVLEPRQASA